uniref:Zinc metalloproteinase n=1 Tax=Parastrongyloides trichosuri TaxID=131310 RepID=A0A0N4Z5R3_PARTI
MRLQKEVREGLGKDGKEALDKHLKKLGTLKKVTDELHGNKAGSEDMNEKVKHALMGNPDLLQGDMILTESHADELIEEAKIKLDAKKHGKNITDKSVVEKLKKNRALMKNLRLKWEFPIPYFSENVDAKKIDDALKDMEANSCLSFKRTSKFSDKSGLRYYPGVGCYSLIGRAFPNKPQDVSIAAGCDYMGIIQHETLHALGFMHEQCRPDRDQFLSINLNNVAPNQRFNYQIVNSDKTETFGIPYNYGSAMQYDKKAFSNNNQVTMITKNKLYQDTIGNKARMAFLDYKMLNKALCSDKCKGGVKCSNGGYEDPRKCGTCKCPYLLTGPKCTDYIKNPSNCDGKNYYKLSNQPVSIKPKGLTSCVYAIEAGPGKKVKLTFGKANQWSRGEFCYADDALEVQYLNDKSLTGVLYCGSPKGSITSEGTLMLVKYTGRTQYCFNELTFTAV